MVVVTIDPKQMAKLIRSVRRIENGVPKVLAPSINRALNKGRTEIKREIRAIYTIKAKDIPIKVRHAFVGRLNGDITVKDKMLDLNKFKVTPRTVTRGSRQRPVHATVRKGKGGFIKHAFIAKMPSGYLGPFVRVDKPRLPIEKLLAIGAGIMASQPTVGPAINKAMNDALAKNVDQQIERFLAKGSK